MGCSSQFIKSTNCLIHEWSGVVTAEDIVRIHIDLIEFANKDSHLHGLLADFTNVTDFLLTENDHKKNSELSIMLSRTIPQLDFVFVARDPKIFEMIDRYKKMSHQSGWLVESFANRNDAESWLSKRLSLKSIK